MSEKTPAISAGSTKHIRKKRRTYSEMIKGAIAPRTGTKDTKDTKDIEPTGTFSKIDRI